MVRGTNAMVVGTGFADVVVYIRCRLPRFVTPMYENKIIVIIHNNNNNNDDNHRPFNSLLIASFGFLSSPTLPRDEEFPTIARRGLAMT